MGSTVAEFIDEAQPRTPLLPLLGLWLAFQVYPVEYNSLISPSLVFGGTNLEAPITNDPARSSPSRFLVLGHGLQIGHGLEAEGLEGQGTGHDCLLSDHDPPF